MDINIDDLSISLKKIICKLENLIEEGDVSKIRALLDDNISWYSENVDFIKYCAMIANNVDGVSRKSMMLTLKIKIVGVGIMYIIYNQSSFLIIL